MPVLHAIPYTRWQEQIVAARVPNARACSGASGIEVVGMNCSACHTRQISANGQTYRIDGGPAIVDFQSLLTDLDTAVGRVLASDAAFHGFAAAVLGPAAPDAEDAEKKALLEYLKTL